MGFALLVLALLLGADDPLCQLHSCSNDTEGVLGDEEICWTGDLTADWYEVRRTDQTEPCSTTTDTCLCLPTTSCLDPDETAYIIVRACSDESGCSDWSESVEFLPFSCLRAAESGDCEDLCEEYSVYRLEEKFSPCP